MRPQRIFGLLLLGVGCGGVTVNSHPLNPAPGPLQPRAASDVAMFTTSIPPYSYVEIAMLEARQESRYAQDDVFESLRARAGQMGCDGLIVLGSADAVAGSVGNLPGSSAVSGSVYTLPGIRATCVVRASGGGPPSQGPTTATGDEIAVATPEATVRTAPSDVAPEVARVPMGVRLAFAGPPSGEWRRVRLHDGRYGFVRELSLKVAPQGAPPPPAPVVVDPRAAPAPGHCDPSCSPGYSCQAGVCTALCNPPCAATDVCGGDRVCRRR